MQEKLTVSLPETDATDAMETTEQELSAGDVEDKRSRRGVAMKALILLTLAGLAVAGCLVWDEYLVRLQQFWVTEVGGPFVTLAKLSFVVAMGSLVWRIILTIMYKPEKPCADEELPTITIVVPAYNEGSQVLKTLRSIVASDYPAEKMQLISVDDGSTDDTWLWMKRAGRELGDRLELCRLDRNSGKRRALYEGFVNATGEILVTIDSDSEIETTTLRHMVTPFVHEAQVGAVAGNVRVLNASKGILPKMLDVSFTFSFDFIRASQSQVNSVLTTPGALSAYRYNVIMPQIEEWLNQQFFGRPANIGEDRALTNMVLKNGFFVRFAREAVVYTEVPVGYRGLCKMFLRWGRSNVRESLAMCRFAFTRFRSGGVLGARVNLLLQLFSMTVGEALKISALITLLSYPLVMGASFLIGTALGGLVPGLFYLMRHRSTNCLWAFPFSLFWVLGLSWIDIYSMLTPQRSSWLTRGLDKEHVTLKDSDTWSVPVNAVPSARTGLR